MHCLRVSHLVSKQRPFGKAHEDERFTGYLCAIKPVNVFYIVRKEIQRKHALRMMNNLMDTFEISLVSRDVLRATLKLEMKDFEDAVQIASAQADGLNFIITRDVKDYKYQEGWQH